MHVMTMTCKYVDTLCMHVVPMLGMCVCVWTYYCGPHCDDFVIYPSLSEGIFLSFVFLNDMYRFVAPVQSSLIF